MPNVPAGLAAGSGQAPQVAGPMGAYLPWPRLAVVYPPGTEPGGGLAGVFPGGGLASNASAGASQAIHQVCPSEIDLPAAW